MPSSSVCAIGLVDVVPGPALRFRRLHRAVGQPVLLRDRDQPALPRLLLHGVDEQRREDVHFVEVAGAVLVEQQLHRPDQLVEVRAVADLRDARRDDAAEPLQETQALAADRAVFDLDALAAPLLVRLQHQPQHVGVEAAAQSLVGRDHHGADALDRLALDQERVAVLGRGLRRVDGDVQHAAQVRPRLAHPVLGLLHLRGRDHFHGLGDLARALHALDLVADFLGSRHRSFPAGALRGRRDGARTRRRISTCPSS